MRQAMLKLHSQTATSSPYFWAAFSVIGRADPIQ
jgi:CHAT domain-containing protein